LAIIVFYPGAWFYIKQILLALYDVCIIRFDVGIIGNSKKVSMLLYRCYRAFYGVLWYYFCGYIARIETKKACKNAAGKEKLYNFMRITGKRKTAGKVFSGRLGYFLF
jgi:hypothetical protein